jgi:geranylgeranyl diphosphate synthase, type II
MDDLAGYLESRRRMVDRAIDGHLPDATREPRAIHECMRYSSSGGKRLRPLIALAVAEMLECPADRVLPTCVALEFIHTHSLILDDLPCMDDDDYRRGRPAAHRAFGESVALLAADALLNLAIALLGSNHRLAGVSPEVALEIIREVGESVGTDGVIGGQMEDLTFSPAAGSPALLERIHLGKTARLFSLSARAGAFVAGATVDQVDAIGLYAEKLGLAFQIVDDILDQDSGGPEVNGKRPSYAVEWGAGPARALAGRATGAALAALSSFGREADRLRHLAQYNLTRTS